MLFRKSLKNPQIPKKGQKFQSRDKIPKSESTGLGLKNLGCCNIARPPDYSCPWYAVEQAAVSPQIWSVLRLSVRLRQSLFLWFSRLVKPRSTFACQVEVTWRWYFTTTCPHTAQHDTVAVEINLSSGSDALLLTMTWVGSRRDGDDAVGTVATDFERGGDFPLLIGMRSFVPSLRRGGAKFSSESFLLNSCSCCKWCCDGFSSLISIYQSLENYHLF